MRNPDVIRVLNDLLAGEQRSLMPRLTESTPFVSWALADESEVIQQMIREEAEHVGWISEMIVAQGTAPAPGLAAIDSGDIHYVELSFIWPRIIESKRDLLAACEAALGQLTPDQDAAALVAKLRGRHHDHLEKLRQFAGSMSSS